MVAFSCIRNILFLQLNTFASVGVYQIRAHAAQLYVMRKAKRILKRAYRLEDSKLAEEDYRLDISKWDGILPQ